MESYIIITGEHGTDHMPHARTKLYKSDGMARACAKRAAKARGPGAWWAVCYASGGGVAHGEIARPDWHPDREAEDAAISKALDEIPGFEPYDAPPRLTRRQMVWRSVCTHGEQVVIIAAGVLVGLCMAGLFIMALAKMGGRV